MLRTLQWLCGRGGKYSNIYAVVPGSSLVDEFFFSTDLEIMNN